MKAKDDLEDGNGIARDVDLWYSQLAASPNEEVHVPAYRVSCLINKLCSNCAPGLDGVTSDHLKAGNSPSLCAALAKLLSLILSWRLVPDSFKTGVIVPVHKKPGINTNVPYITTSAQ